MLKDKRAEERGLGRETHGEGLKRHWEARAAVEICLREELGDGEKEAGEGGLRGKTFHGNKVLGARTGDLKRVVYWSRVTHGRKR